ncbi:MAG: efflux transporter outer membrane subunit [Planctomycetota bacterium]|nr:MAG: efflux transporter outer membrane subunit [Planctomycetota bacterium]
MNYVSKRLLICLTGWALCTTSCTAFLPKRHTADEGTIPQSYTDYVAETERPERWWEAFESDELNALMEEAFAENLTLRQMWARLDQADAAAIKAGADLYPQLSLEASASYDRSVRSVEGSSTSLKSQLGNAVVNGVTQGVSRGISSAISGGQGGLGNLGFGGGRTTGGQTTGGRVTTETKQFGLSLTASYELDIWGRVRSERQSARFDLEASREDMESAAMTVAAEVVNRWLGIIEQQAQKQLLEDQLKTNQTYLELVELRFRKSLVSALDVYQQRQTVAGVKKQIPLIESQERVLRHELAVLLGKPPATEYLLGGYDLEKVPPLPRLGVPAKLLINRPDVRAALGRLNAADYRVAVARADQLPAIRLTGGIGYSADDFSNLFNDWFVNLAGNLTAPLFDGFRRAAEVDRTKAVVEERLAAYRLAVLTAIKEVEDALVQERKQREHIAALTQQLEDARNALREAGQRYQKGLSDYLPVLTSLEGTQFLTRNLITARRDLLIFRVNLYRALGGIWTNDLEPPRRLSEEDSLVKAEK